MYAQYFSYNYSYIRWRIGEVEVGGTVYVFFGITYFLFCSYVVPATKKGPKYTKNHCTHLWKIILRQDQDLGKESFMFKTRMEIAWQLFFFKK